MSIDWYLTVLLGNISSLRLKFAFLIDKLTVAANFKCKHFLRFVQLAEACYKISVKHTESVLAWPQQENVSVNILDPHKIDWNW